MWWFWNENLNEKENNYKQYKWQEQGHINVNKWENEIYMEDKVDLYGKWMISDLFIFCGIEKATRPNQQQGTTSHAQASGKCSSPSRNLLVFWSLVTNIFNYIHVK